MYIPEKMKINRYREVRIPGKGEYFNTGRYTSIPAQYGGDEPVDVIGTNKTDNAAELVRELDREQGFE